jgi:catechol 2,3-dioxygenase-like lactoylglutathione lyase family enzyme
MPAVSGFHHVAIRSSDFDRSLQFYTTVLQFQIRVTWGQQGERAVMLDVGDGNYLEIFERAPSEVASEGVILHFALRTDDCAALTERVRAAGAEVTMEPKEIVIDSNIGPVPVKISFFKGPDGEIIEFFENQIL